MALYRKYRPTTLADVIGQEQVTSVLNNSLKQDKISHAYLFIGPRGTGKTSVARILAHAVNGFKYEVEDSYLDIIEIDAASNTGVDNIRELREKAIIAPSDGKYKVYIIDEVHMLTKSASNALLKTLEEPPAHVIFIMATTDAHKVPITISSRTQVFTFKLADAETMLKHLQNICQKEKIAVDDDALKLVITRGGGSFRDTLSLLDQISSLSDQKITAEMVQNALGLPSAQIIQQILQAVTNGDNDTIHSQLFELLNSGMRAETITEEIINQIMRNPEPQTIQALDKLTNVKPPFAEAKLLVALITSSSAPVTKSQAATNKTMASPVAVPEVVAKGPITPETVTEMTIEKPKHDANGVFSWDNLLSNIHQNYNALYTQLTKCDYDFKDNTLHLYPTSKFTKKFLEKNEHKQIIMEYLSGFGLAIHDQSDSKLSKDPTLSQISAIMGSVQEADGEMPF